jgi:hypothetical protein
MFLDVEVAAQVSNVKPTLFLFWLQRVSENCSRVLVFGRFLKEYFLKYTELPRTNQVNVFDHISFSKQERASKLLERLKLVEYGF